MGALQFSTASNALNGMEAMRMIQKGQLHHIGKDVVRQNDLICELFGLVAA